MNDRPFSHGDSAIHEAVMGVVWRRREAFYAEAVERAIVTSAQADALLDLHRERDAEQEAREGTIR